MELNIVVLLCFQKNCVSFPLPLDVPTDNIINLQPQELGGLTDDGVGLGEAHFLEAESVRGRNISASDTDGGGGQVVESIFHSHGKEFGTDTVHGETRFDSHQAAGLLDRLDDGLNIERLDGSQVDNFGVDAVLLLQLGGGIEGQSDAAREGDDGQVLTRTLNLGLSDRKDEVVLASGLAHGECLTVKQSVRRIRNLYTTPAN